jgi:hypothetical protein
MKNATTLRNLPRAITTASHTIAIWQVRAFSLWVRPVESGVRIPADLW